WTDGGKLDAHSQPDSLQNQYGRTAYEKTLQLPANAQDFRVAFHIVANLVADPHFQYVTQWYNAPDGHPFVLGQSYTLRDTWDNDQMPNGFSAFTASE